MLHRDSLKGALEEAKRAKHAGFFTFVLGDGEGNLANVEGSPKDLVVETSRGRMLRVGYGSRKMTNTPEGKTPPQHARCGVIHRLFDKRKTPLDRAANNCTNRAIDPISNIPEYKICAVRVSKAAPPDDAIARLGPEAGGVLR